MDSRMTPRDFFIFHVTRGNLQEVEQAVRVLKVNVNIVCDRDINTAAHIAVRNNNPQLLALLIALGADLGRRNLSKQTVIEYAAAMATESWECYELISAGAEKKRQAVTLLANQQLHVAVKLNSHERVGQLMQLGADGNIKDEAGRTPGQLALMLGHMECVQLLVPSVEQAVDEAIKREDKEFLQAFFAHTKIPLKVARIIVVSDREMIMDQKIINKEFWAFLGRKFPASVSPIVKIQTLSGLSPELNFPHPVVQLPKKQLIIEAVKANDVAELRKILVDDTFPVVLIDKEMPLHYAVRTRNLSLLELMIRKHAKINISVAGLTALDLAMDTGEIKYVNAFLYENPFIADLDFWRKALLRACRLNLTEVAKMLLPHVAKISVEDELPMSFISEENGYTCFHWAVQNDNPELVTLLMRFNYYQEQVVTVGHRTPAKLAILLGRTKCVDLLAPSFDRVMDEAMSNHDIDLVCAILRSQKPVNNDKFLGWVKDVGFRKPHLLDRLMDAVSERQRLLEGLNILRFQVAIRHDDFELVCKLIPMTGYIDPVFFEWATHTAYHDPAMLEKLVAAATRRAAAPPVGYMLVSEDLLPPLNRIRYQSAIEYKNENLICELILLGEQVDEKFWAWVERAAEYNSAFIEALKVAAVNRPDLLQQLKARFAGLPDEISDLFVDLTAAELKDPMITSHGDTYSRSTLNSINVNPQTGKKHHPITREPLEPDSIYPNKIVSVLLKHYKSGADLKVVPPCLICPISKKLFRFPMVANNGETYEAAALPEYLWKNSQKLPGGTPFTRSFPNELVKNLIEKMKYGVEAAPVQVAVVPVKGAELVKQLAAVSVPLVAPSPAVAPVINPASPAAQVQAAAPSLDKIMELFDDALTYQAFEEPVIYFDGRTFSKSSVVDEKGQELRDPHAPDATKKIIKNKLLPNLLVAELLVYFANPEVDLTKIPPGLICAETGRVYDEPVVALDGKTYERANLVSYLESHDQLLPGSQIEQSQTPYRNKVVAQLVELFKPAPSQAAQPSAPEPRSSSQGMFAAPPKGSDSSPQPVSFRQ